jgi:hypothetical protein
LTNPAERPALERVAETPQERLKRYRLDRFVTTLPKLPPPHGDIDFDPARADLKGFYILAPVKTLDDLKLWIGSPNDEHAAHTAASRGRPLSQVGPAPALLDDAVIAAAEQQVLFGRVDDALLSDPFWSGIVSGLLRRYSQIPILIAQDLVVPDRTTVRIANTPTAFFHRVTVYGSGTIRILSDCKLITETFEVLLAPSTSGGPGATTGQIG